MGIARFASPLFAAALFVVSGMSNTHAQMLGQTQATPAQPVPAQNGAYAGGYGVQQAPPPPPMQQVPPPPAGWVPTFDSVLTSSASQTSFTFDRNMLKATDNFLSGSDPETRRIVAGLNSITVRTFHAREYARYDPGALAMIDGQYRASGWKHLVNANGKGSSTITDLWLHYSGANINGLTVLNRGDRNMTVISVDCTLRPLDLLHLGGHFGIPKVDENAVMVPAH